MLAALKAGSLRSAFPIANVEPTGAVTLSTRKLAVLSRGLTDGTNLPIRFVWRTANDARAALANGDLRALAADHFRGIREGSAARTYGYRLWFLLSRLGRHRRSQLQTYSFWKWAGHDGSGNHRLPGLFAVRAKHYFMPSLAGLRVMDHRKSIHSLAMRTCEVH